MNLFNKKFEIGNHCINKQFDCLNCAEQEYNELNGEKYLMNKHKNKLIHNTYGWKNE